MISHYDWRGQREGVLRFGPADAPVVVFAQPLFEEANRLRALVATMARSLAVQGFAAAVPDLPGTGESLTDSGDVRLADWREAFAAACDSAGPVRLVASLRSGALFDGDIGAIGHWRLAPHTGGGLIRELLRTRLAGLREDGREATIAMLTTEAQRDGIELSGHWLTPGLFGDLQDADALPAAPLRTVRLASDARPADHLIDAPPLWRRAEPDNDIAFAEMLVGDIVDWVRTCRGG